MADIFKTEDVKKLFKNKFIFMLGDSNMRASYRDLVLLVCRNELLSLQSLRKRGEPSFEGDERIDFSTISKGRHYRESRQFLKYNVHIEYHFITRCYTDQIVDFLERIKKNVMKCPDVFIMNSCIWDITRWGPNGVDNFKDNMKKLMLKLNECLPKETLFIWTTTLPVSTILRGGLLIKQIDFLQHMLRFEVMEANVFCRQLVVSHGYDVLDLHYHLRMQIHRRLRDGLHFGPLPTRYITNLLLTHIALSWDVPLPGNSYGIALERIKSATLSTFEKEVILPSLPSFLCHGELKHHKTKIIDKIDHCTPYKKTTISGRQLNFNRGHNRNKIQYGKSNNALLEWKSGPIQQQNSHDYRSQEFWSDEFIDQRPQNRINQYQRNNYADFDKVGGPVRKNKYQNNRTRPY